MAATPTTAASSLAWGYIPTELAAAGTTGFEIEIIGKRRPARLQLEPILDPRALECALRPLLWPARLWRRRS